MKRIVSFGLVMIMFLASSGCIWWHDRGERDHERGGYGEHERDGGGDHDRGDHDRGDHDRGGYDGGRYDGGERH